jgi:hypothetical protein
MNAFKLTNRLALLALMAGSIALAGSACDTSDPTNIGSCDLNFANEVNATFDSGQLDALIEASARFGVTSRELDQGVRDACNAISTDLGAATSDDTAIACANASDAIDAAFAANAQVTVGIEFIPGVCSVAAQAIIDCTAECDVNFDATATPPTCTGGMLSGGCSGSCSGSCSVDASASCTGSCTGSCSGTCDAVVSATCTGTCSGQCEGTCDSMDGDGNCNGNCTGTCRGSCSGTIEGTCSGSCSGSCAASCTADVSGSCEGSCSGSCDVDFVAPTCEGGTLEVMASAECKSACESDASFEVECTEAELVLSYTGTVGDQGQLTALVATLEANYPTILAVADKTAIVVGTATDLATQLSGAASTAASISLEAADCLAQAVEVQVAAATSVSVTVEASVEVSGSVSAGS